MAIAKAVRDIGPAYEGYEVWECHDEVVTVRAWDDTGDYAFYTARAQL
jgi:hypothetical protein